MLSRRLIYQVLIHLLVLASILSLSTPSVTFDGWQYISSGKSLLDGSFVSNYFTVRQPLYPLFIGICLKLFDSLWTVLIAQIVINSVAIHYFLNSVFKYSPLRSIQAQQKVKFFSAFFIWCFLSSYPSFILAQNLFTPLILIFISLVLKSYSQQFSSKENRTNCTIILILILSFLLAKELFLAFFLYWFILGILQKRKQKRFLVNVLTIFLIVFSLNVTLNSIKSSIQSKSGYNIENQEDIFQKTNLVETLLQRIQADPPYTQTMIYAAIANLDLAPTLGWDGIALAKYESPGHPARLFALNHILQLGSNCNYFPDSGVLVVDENYVKAYFGCDEPLIIVPNSLKKFFYGIYLVLWPFMVLIYLRSLLMGRNTKIEIFPIVFVSCYSMLGAGISRYGTPIYPIIIVIAIAGLANIHQNRVRKLPQPME